MFTNNNQWNKSALALFIKNNISVKVKPEQTFTRNGIETILADLNRQSGIITVGLVYKRSVDISTENFSTALKERISSLDQNIKTYIIINLLDYSSSPRIEIFLNFMISCNFYPVISSLTRVWPISCTLIVNIFSNRVDEQESTGVITTNISNHYPIFSREIRPPLADNVLSINYRVFSYENIPNFRNSLQYTNWQPILNTDANESYKLFHFLLQTKHI